MNTRFLIPLLCAGALAFARMPSSHAAKETTASSAKKAAVSTSPLASSLRVSVGDDVDLTLEITNTSGKRLELQFPSGLTHDFAVVDSAGREVWRWSAGRMFTQSLQTRMLDAGETVTYRETWTGGTPHASYEAVGLLVSKNHPIESRARFTLP